MALPEGIYYDSHTSALCYGPGGTGISDSESKYRTATNSNVDADAQRIGTNTKAPYSFSYKLIAGANVASGSSLHASSYCKAGGIKMTGLDEYQATGDSNHRIYLTAESSRPDTTRVVYRFSSAANGSLAVGITSPDPYVRAKAWVSFHVDAWSMEYMEAGEYDEFETGWYDDTKLASGYGRASIETDSFGTRTVSEGIFEGDVRDGASSATLGGSTTIEFGAEVGDLTMVAMSLLAVSKLEFYHTILDAKGWAQSDFSHSATYSVTAYDPDHPDAVITIIGNVVPEPSAACILALAGLVALRRRR